MIKVFVEYVATFCVVNLVVNNFGPWVVPFTTMCCVAANMLGRDRLLLKSGPQFSISACIVAGTLTVFLNTEALQVALGSLAAVTTSGCVSAVAWRVFPGRRWLCNVISGAADSLVFPTVAFLTFLPGVCAAMFAGKVVAVTIMSYLMREEK